LWTMDLPLARRALAAAERWWGLSGAFLTSVRCLRALRALIEDDIEAAARLLEEDPAPWRMTTASSRLRCLGAEVALAMDDVDGAERLVADVESHIAGPMYQYLAALYLLRAEVARRRDEVREGDGYAHAALELAA